MTGDELITAERRRQRDVEGWTPEHDAEHTNGEMVSAARAYEAHALMLYAPNNPAAAPAVTEPPVYPYWPWGAGWWRPTWDDGGVRDLVKAGALIAAEIDRLLALGAEGDGTDG